MTTPRRLRQLQRFLLVCAAAGALQLLEAETALVPAGAVWKYLDNGVDLGTAWREPAFNDSAWRAGPAQLGFGDGDEATVINNSLTNRPITTYFRRSFEVADPGAFSSLTVRLLRDDGAVVYLNGVQVFRNNLPDGPVTFNTLALTAVGGEEERTVFFPANVDRNLLHAGLNVLAVEVHQVNVTSSDLSFDLQLIADGNNNVLPLVSVAAIDASTSEISPQSAQPPDPAVFRITRSGPTTSALSVHYELSGSASNGVDYTGVPGTVEIPASAEGVELVVNAIDDSLVEGTESIILNLVAPACVAIVPPPPGCYGVGSSSRAEVSIRDNDRPENSPPTVYLVTPSEGAMFTAPTNITLLANADDPDGYLTLVSVEFFEGSHSLGIRTNYPTANPVGPFIIGWNNVPPGEYTLTAVATDDHGARTTSAAVHIAVRQFEQPSGTLIATGAVWKYLDNGSDQGTAWRGREFNDSSWNAGPAQLGYGDGDEATVVDGGPDPNNKYITTYFRRAFELPSASAVRSLSLRVLRDDGVVVYLNGTEVYRNNMPGGPVTFNTLAASVAADENAYLTAVIPPNALVNGRNVVAAEVHQVNPTSSDLGFDLGLSAESGGPIDSNRPPVVSIVSPTNGAAFSAPTDIRIEAVTRDVDGYADMVEFFANEQKIGEARVVFIQPPAPGEPIQFEFTWANAPVGRHRLTARTHDNQGALGMSAPVEITVLGDPPPPPGPAELHVVGIYSGTAAGSSANHERGAAAVVVNRPGKRVTLLLSSYEPVLWHIAAGDATVVEKVILGGYYRQEVQGLGPDVQIVQASYENGNGDYLYIGTTLNSGRFFQVLTRLCALTGLDISSFQGRSQAPYPAPFVIDAIQQDERLRCNYPQPTPLSELPNLSFRLDFQGNDNSGAVFSQSYTLGGTQNGARLLPAMRVIADAGGRYYYGTESQEVWKLDTQTHTVEQMHLGPNVPELSWPRGVAFDSHRNRVLLVSLGGEGFLYAYSPSLNQWSLVASMDNKDVDCLEYHAAGDALYAVKISHADYGDAAVYEFSPDGAFRREIALPVLPFNISPGGYRSELASVGDYLVLLLEPEPGAQQGESRIYLIDPRTAQVWLAYRRVAQPENRPPSVTISSPTEGTTFPAGSSIRLEAFASDADGSVRSVEFFADNHSLGQGESSPNSPSFHFTWTGAAAGQHILTARATDDRGATTLSAGVRIIVGTNTPPPTNVLPVVTIRAVDPDGAEQGSNPATFLLTRSPAGNASLWVYYRTGGTAANGMDYAQLSGSVEIPAGTESAQIVLQPIDDALVEGPETVEVSLFVPQVVILIFPPPPPPYSLGEPHNAQAVIQDNDFTPPPPTNGSTHVTMVSPGNGAIFNAGAAIILGANAPSQNGPVQGVAFFANEVKIGDADGPFATPAGAWLLVWSNAPAGQYAVTAKATDASGVMAVSLPIHISVVGTNSTGTADSDHDGVPDNRDRCPNTPAGAVVNADGCSVLQLVPCDAPWRNHSEYVERVIQQAWTFYRQGLITETARQILIGEATQSSCGGDDGLRIHLQPQTREEIRVQGLCLVLSGNVTGTCVLEYSTDLVHWSPIQNYRMPNLGMEMIDPQAGQTPMRFYRVRVTH